MLGYCGKPHQGVDGVGTREARPRRLACRVRGVGRRCARREGMYPVSYRSFKHLLGETSLERKCRFIFGGGILVLVSISFYWYGQKTESLVIAQTNQTARILVDMKRQEHPQQGVRRQQRVRRGPELASSDDLTSIDDLPKYEADVIRPHETPARPLRAVRPGEVPQVGLGGGGLPEARGRRRSLTPSATALRRGQVDPARARRSTSTSRRSCSSPSCLIGCHSGSHGRIDDAPVAPGGRASGRRPRPATWPASSWSPCRWSRRRRRSTTTGPS